jgi:hypothetical protein
MADKPQPLTADRLRSELEAWATRVNPWTGPASMTAEDGYNAAIEEVVAILNYRDHDARVAAPSDARRFLASTSTPRDIIDAAFPETTEDAQAGYAAHKRLREAVWSAQHDATCDDGEPHPWTDHLPWDEAETERAAIAEADAIIDALMPARVAAPSDDLRAKAETLECIRQHFGATRRCDEYDDGREPCAPCYVRTALATTGQPDAPSDGLREALARYRAALATTEAPTHGPDGNEGYCRCGYFGGGREHRDLADHLDAATPTDD